jgi:peptidoglycan/LPS O-acetylase OafA/YrhL
MAEGQDSLPAGRVSAWAGLGDVRLNGEGRNEEFAAELTARQRTDPRSPVGVEGRVRPPQLRALTSIRFFAALHVMLYHLVHPFGLWGPLAAFMSAGYAGVSFFFLLSGFLLTYAHAAETGVERGFVKRFYFARFARIYPLYFAALALSVYVNRDQLENPIHGVAVVADALLVQTWSLRMVSFFNIPAWSVASEAFFYAVFPFVFLRLRAASRGRAVGGFAGFWVLAMVMPVVALIWFPAGAWQEGGGLFAFWVRRCPVLALPEFLAGISLGWLWVDFRPKFARPGLVVMLASAALIGVLLFAGPLPTVMLHNGLLLPLYALIVIGLCAPSWVGRVLSWAPLVLLGEASYALYLIHFTMEEWSSYYHHVPQGLPQLVWKVPGLLAMSIGLYLVVERPARTWLLRWWNRRHPVPATAD